MVLTSFKYVNFQWNHIYLICRAKATLIVMKTYFHEIQYINFLRQKSDFLQSTFPSPLVRHISASDSPAMQADFIANAGSSS